MNDKKSIDRLYQEKFRDFEMVPNDLVWQNISAKIRNKKKRRILPIWSRIAGVAAAIAIFFSIGNQFFEVTPSVVEVGENPVLKNTEKEPAKVTRIADQNSVTPSAEKLNENFSENKSIIISKPSERKSVVDQIIEVKTESADTKIVQTFPNFENHGFFILKTENLNYEDSDISASLSKADFSENQNNKLALLEIEKTEEEIQNTPTKTSKVKIGTFASPIYYNGFGEGNVIDPQFADNKQKTEVTMSYGINFSYAITDNIKIRSGVSKVAMSYNTMDIAFGPDMNPVLLRNVDYNNYGDHIEIADVRKSNSTDPYAPQNQIDGLNTDLGYINQKLAFIELPVEVEFTIIDKRFALNLIGGASTLFVDENTISVHSRDVSTPIGESSNLNDVSFSTNIGFGVGYKLSKKFQLNVEPMFKYQINTFSSGNFNPYYLGIYSGIQYKF
ncbi:MAG TPA: hypothetical protein VFM70_11010 [Salinimicrobium sp.]|nr:hypothetical protein [Salinimicrobium sp.]